MLCNDLLSFWTLLYALLMNVSSGTMIYFPTMNSPEAQKNL